MPASMASVQSGGEKVKKKFMLRALLLTLGSAATAIAILGMKTGRQAVMLFGISAIIAMAPVFGRLMDK